jgi:hypothetical protein
MVMGGSGESRRCAEAADVKRVHGEGNGIAPDTVLEDHRLAGDGARGNLGGDLRIAPSLHSALRAAEPDLTAALGRAETGTRKGHYGGAGDAGRGVDGGDGRGVCGERHGVGPGSALLHHGAADVGLDGHGILSGLTTEHTVRETVMSVDARRRKSAGDRRRGRSESSPGRPDRLRKRSVCPLVTGAGM